MRVFHLGKIDDTMYTFDTANKRILKTQNIASIIISEPMFFMELDEYYTFIRGKRVLDEKAKNIAEKYLLLKNGVATPYSKALLLFECWDNKFKIVLQFRQLILRWYGSANENNRQKEAIILAEQLEQGFTKWDIGKYEKVIRHEIARKNIRANEFDEFLEGISLPKFIQDMSFHIVLKQGGCAVSGGILEKFDLHKNKDDIIKISWSVGFGGSGFFNNGAGGSAIIPAEYFVKHDLSAFATYVANKYQTLVTYNEIRFNSELQILFELLALDSEK